MKLITLNFLSEWYTGSLQVPNLNQVKEYLKDATQEKYHLVIKNAEDKTAFVYLYKLDSNYFYYILADHITKDYIGHCLIKNINEVMQPLETFVLEAYRGNALAPRLYSYISKANNKFIINSNQLSLDAGKMWKKFPDRKIYQMSKNKFYELNDPKAEDPEQDKDILDQDWFFAFKEERNILESYKYLGECFNYSLFLDNKPAFLVGDEYISIYPMSPNI